MNLPLSDDTVSCRMLVYGLQRSATMDIDRRFLLPHLPAGSYRVLFVLNAPLPTVIHYPESVTVISDSIIDIGTIKVPRIEIFSGCGTRQCDSVAIRAILDINGLAGVPLDSVAAFDRTDGRIVGLVLDSLGIGTVPPEIGSLSRLRTLSIAANDLLELPSDIGYCASLCSLNLNYNRLGVLPADLQYLDSLTALSVRGNALTGFPEPLGYLALRSLDLSDNRLETLPQTVVYLTSLEQLSLAGNCLLSLPPDIAAWADSLDADWRMTQDCSW